MKNKRKKWIGGSTEMGIGMQQRIEVKNGRSGKGKWEWAGWKGG